MRDLDDLSGHGLSEEAGQHLRALLADWQLLADLSFSDLLLWVPRRGQATSWPEGHIVLAQVRPSTGPTVFTEDLIGHTVAWGERSSLDTALSEGRIVREQGASMRSGLHLIETTIPVLHDNQVIAVISQHTSPTTARTPSRLELVYLETGRDLAEMIMRGLFPEPGAVAERAPRVGDGLIRLDVNGVITYASPNAASALRRLGVAAAWEGAKLGSLIADVDTTGLAPTDEGWTALLSGRTCRVVTVLAAKAAVDLRVIPLLPSGVRVGALVLVHDVTEISRRDRELVTKTATIREIHHRVKNNLQTVAALLRLQARRVDDESARLALEEAVRRVGSIAVVHETLSSTGADDDVAFDDVVDRVIEMLSQVAGRPRVIVEREGAFGDLPSAIATPLSMVVNELVSNALEHGVADRGSKVVVSVVRGPDRLTLNVSDDGVGLPPDFQTEEPTGLGMQIVNTLVAHELRGEISFNAAATGSGTVIRVELPLSGSRPG